MKVLLVQPPVYGLTVKNRIIEPLSLEILGATIINDHDVKLLDLRIHDNFEEKFEELNPDVVGFTCYICQVTIVHKYLQKAKKIKPHVICMVGGEQPTHEPDEFNIPEVDFIVQGDADISFPKLIQYIDLKKTDPLSIPGVIICKDGKLYKGTEREILVDLTSSPLPARELTVKYRTLYKFLGWSPLGSLSAVRGCKYRCNFCSIWKIRKGITAHFPIHRVIKELQTIKEENIYFCEAHSFQNIAYMQKLIKGIIDHNIKKKYMMYIRVDSVVRHFHLIKEWHKHGLKRIFIGFEAISDERLKSFNKAATKAQNEQAIELLHNEGIEIVSSFIINLDFNEKDFVVLTDWVTQMNLTMPIYNILTPLPGNQLYEKNRDFLKTIPYDYFDFNHALLDTTLPKNIFYKHIAELYRRTYSNDISNQVKEKLGYTEDLLHKRKKVGELLAKNIELSMIT